MIELPKVIRKALEADDETPPGKELRYGVREFSDWKEDIIEIERELTARKEPFVPIDLSPKNPTRPTAPIAVEKLLYERIRECLEHDDLLPPGVMKTYGVREFPDWKKTAKEFEREMEKKRIQFAPIKW